MNSMPTLESLGAHLRALVPGAELEFTSESRLLIYSTDSITVGFCIAEAGVEEEYESSYEAFKTVFSARVQAKLEPSFVLCVDSELKDIEKLSSSIETDVYFCRKYVLSYSGDIDGMLSHLPFLPLVAIGTTGLRPETAQTFLKQKGAPIELAQHIAAPARRSAASIVDLCLSGHYGNFRHPEDIKVVESEGVPAQEATDAVVVESIKIQGFRAYKKPANFDLGSQITFLYGPNGFGKTSFFDAFDFALTGGIGRLDTDSRGADLQSLATHLDTASELANVSMVLRSGTVKIAIERNVVDSKSAKVDGEKTDRKALLSRVTGADTPSAERVENLVNLFRATHLFSQEQQELTKDMQAKSELSADIVSRMLALDDYATASGKLTAVVSEIETRVRACRTESARAAARAMEAEQAISDLIAKIGDAPQVDLDALVFPLVEETVALGGSVSAQDSPVTTLRGLRASLEYVLAKSNASKETLSALRERALSRGQLASQVQKLRAEVADRQKDCESLEAERQELHASLATLTESVTRGVQRVSVLVEERSRTAWTLANLQPYQALVRSTQELEVLRPDLIASVQERSQVSKDAAAELAFLEGRLGLQREDLAAAESRLVSAKHLVDQTSTYPTLSAGLADKRMELARLQSDATALASAIASGMSAAAETKLIAAQLARTLAEQERSNDEIRSLIDRLRGHVHGPECPFCGHDHGSEAALKATLLRLDALDPLAGLRQEAREVRERELESVRRVVELEEKAESLKASIRSTASSVDGSEKELARLAAQCIAVGIDVSDGQSPITAVQAYAERCNEELNEILMRLSATQKLTEQKRLEVAAYHEQLLRLRADQESNDARIGELRREIAFIEGNSAFNLQEMSIQLEELRTRATKLDDDIALASAEVSSSRASIASAQATLSGVDTRLASVRSSETRAKEQLAEVMRVQEALNHDLARSKVLSEDPVTQIDSALGTLSHQQSDVKELIERVASAEVAADAAMTAAALSAHRSTLKQQKVAEAKALDEAKRYEPWLARFRSLSEKVKHQTHDAVTTFTTNYGPRTSVIQKRLRAVYGFDEVSITPVDSRIAVSVSRHGRRLRPTDYFSQSQQQTLLLGLFLTACSSQTWSDFGPVLLDDPVAHFDDLNTYAFLDLIRGLLLDEGRQFIISTCDERFMQMAMRKFKSLGEGAKFYRFRSIGLEGPDVVEM